MFLKILLLVIIILSLLFLSFSFKFVFNKKQQIPGAHEQLTSAMNEITYKNDDLIPDGKQDSE